MEFEAFLRAHEPACATPALFPYAALQPSFFQGHPDLHRTVRIDHCLIAWRHDTLVPLRALEVSR